MIRCPSRMVQWEGPASRGGRSAPGATSSLTLLIGGDRGGCAASARRRRPIRSARRRSGPDAGLRLPAGGGLGVSGRALCPRRVVGPAGCAGWADSSGSAVASWTRPDTPGGFARAVTPCDGGRRCADTLSSGPGRRSVRVRVAGGRPRRPGPRLQRPNERPCLHALRSSNRYLVSSVKAMSWSVLAWSRNSKSSRCVGSGEGGSANS